MNVAKCVFVENKTETKKNPKQNTKKTPQKLKNLQIETYNFDWYEHLLNIIRSKVNISQKSQHNRTVLTG